MAAIGSITTIHLIRHGETDWNIKRIYQGTSDIPLNATGLQQAATLGAWLAANPLEYRGTAVIASPLQRAFVTAEAIAAAREIAEIIPEPDVMERAYGVAEGYTLQERLERWSGDDWEGLEPWENVALRAQRAIDRVLATRPGETTFVVCHGGFINAVIGSLGHDPKIIVNTSITTITHDGTGWTLGSFNETPHQHDGILMR